MRSIWLGCLMPILILALPCLHRMGESCMPFISFFINMVVYVFAFFPFPFTIQGREPASESLFFCSFLLLKVCLSITLATLMLTVGRTQKKNKNKPKQTRQRTSAGFRCLRGERGRADSELP